MQGGGGGRMIDIKKKSLGRLRVVSAGQGGWILRECRRKRISGGGGVVGVMRSFEETLAFFDRGGREIKDVVD